MNKETRVGCLGLEQQPNPYALTNPGSLASCANVVSRRKGILMPLPALENAYINEDSQPITPADGHYPVKLLGGWNADVFFAVERPVGSDTADVLRYFGPASSSGQIPTIQYGTSSEQVNFLPGQTQASLSRDRIFITEKDAPIVYETNSAPGVRPAGLPPPTAFGFQPLDDDDDVKWLTPNSVVAYRAVFRYKTDDFQVVSAPSGAFCFFNYSGVDVGVLMVVRWDETVDPILPGMEVVVYRTETIDFTATSPVIGAQSLSDDFREVAVATLSAANISSGFVGITDKTLAENRRQPLYTNSDQQGLTQQNNMPPPSRDVVTYNDTTFYTSKASWPIVTLTIPGRYGELIGGTGVPSTLDIWYNMIGVRTPFSAPGATMGSNTISGVAQEDRDGLVVGQFTTTTTTFPAAVFPAGTRITNISSGPAPYTITFSNNATASGQWSVSDFVTIAATKDGVTLTESFPLSSDPLTLAVLLVQATTVHGIRVFPNGYFVTGNGTFATQTGGSLTIWSPLSGWWDSFTVEVSHGLNYSDAEILSSGNGFFESRTDNSKNRIYYSKTSLPEAVGPLQYLDVGNERVIKLWPTESALFALCTDGLWRITGVGTSWSVNQIDRSLSLLGPDLVGVLDNQIYALFEDGLSVLGENGATLISENAIGPALRSYIASIRGNLLDSWGSGIYGDNICNEIWLNINTNMVGFDFHFDTFIFNRDQTVFTRQTAQNIQCQLFVPFLHKYVTATKDAYLVPRDNAWEPARVQFNPIVGGDLGYLKQWVDLNWFCDGVVPNDTAFTFQTLFGGEDGATGNNVRTYTGLDVTRTMNSHFWIPRRVGSKNFLRLGFQTDTEPSSPGYFELYGFAVRARVASETIKRA